MVEAMKDGLTGDDILYVALHGEIIEEYPERNRCLLYVTVQVECPCISSLTIPGRKNTKSPLSTSLITENGSTSRFAGRK